jgi:hypothetical protein
MSGFARKLIPKSTSAGAVKAYLAGICAGLVACAYQAAPADCAKQMESIDQAILRSAFDEYMWRDKHESRVVRLAVAGLRNAKSAGNAIYSPETLYGNRCDAITPERDMALGIDSTPVGPGAAIFAGIF